MVWCVSNSVQRSGAVLAGLVLSSVIESKLPARHGLLSMMWIDPLRCSELVWALPPVPKPLDLGRSTIPGVIILLDQQVPCSVHWDDAKGVAERYVANRLGCADVVLAGNLC